MPTLQKWHDIGETVRGSNDRNFSFAANSFKSRVGDLIAVRMEVPNAGYTARQTIYVWGRIVDITRFNPFFPYEAALELSHDGIPLIDTILSTSRDQLEASVLILGCTYGDEFKRIFPLTYPVQPAAQVLYPPAEVIRELLASGIPGHTPLKLGTLIARSDVEIEVSADRLVARHMAILAMTGGGKTVAARRILRELIEKKYPILILDPHGDYLGIWEKQKLFPESTVRLLYPHISMTEDNRGIVEILIGKMTTGLTEAQRDQFGIILAQTQPVDGEPVLEYIMRLLGDLEGRIANARDRRQLPTLYVVKRSLGQVAQRLERMEQTNERMRNRLNRLKFTQLPDPNAQPEGIVRPGMVSILYLGGYDHLTQTTIASIVLESLYDHRANLSGRIPPFVTLIEEAHTFIPSAREGQADVPSLETLRKLITEGRKFGTGLLLVSQRPSRVDETILAQCHSFLILRLVNPRDQSYVKQIMENLDEKDARMLPGFGPGQGIVSGQAVRFPLLVSIKMDEDLIYSDMGDENFFQQSREWKPDAKAATRESAGRRLAAANGAPPRRQKKKNRR